MASLTHGDHQDPCWTEDRDRLLIRAVDSLHRTADIDDALWSDLAGVFSESELLDLLMLTGWYRAISYVARVCRVQPEDGTPSFDSVSRKES
ncbi:MAG TPA: hypothetical protein VGS21_10705 [Acidimicrobiales bacterium]|nr:hypothetical protein [Acidimicrobiales bacterium]